MKNRINAILLKLKRKEPEIILILLLITLFTLLS